MLVGAPLDDWVGNGAAGPAPLDTLPSAHPVSLPWRPRFERTGVPAPPTQWECLGHRQGQLALIEWLPRDSRNDDMLHQSQVFNDLGAVIGRLREAQDLAAFLGACVQTVQDFTSFDRVMIYRFLADGSGEIVAEHTAPPFKTLYLGMRFPASDIPAQARTLYLSNKLRVLADVEASMDSLIPPRLPDGSMLNQSFCLLRGLSPVHLAYLRNMGVRATLTLSIVCDGKLWGLIACHHHQPRTPPHHVREGMRQVCELLAEFANMRIEALVNLGDVRKRLALEHLLNEFQQTLMMEGDIAGVLDAWHPRLVRAFDASGFGLRIGSLGYVGGRARRHGPGHLILDQVAERVQAHERLPRVQMWDDLLTPPRPTLSALPEAAGLLLAQQCEDEAVFCFMTRREVVQQVRWGGEPGKEVLSHPDGLVRLEPRRSFAEWRQSLKGRCDPWTPIEAQALQNLLRILCEVNKLQINRKLQETLHWRAHHDSLTGLYNRRAMEDEVARRLQAGQYDIVLMLMDLDHFKKINDTYGHETGDRVLQQLSVRLKSVMREFDLLARLGGDEFVLVLRLPHPNPGAALTFAERLHRAVTVPLGINGHRLRLAISIGIAFPPAHGRTVSELLRHADLALYRAKSLGRSRSVVFELEMATSQLDYYMLERDLGEAVEGEQLSLVFQPKVDLSRRTVIGMEALVRWHHPTRGENSPGAFIPIAELSDQIVRIDRWVMRNAIAHQARWRQQGRRLLPIAINLSVADILSPNLVSYLTELLKEHEVEPELLEVEVTESSCMRELSQACAVLRALNDSGIRTTLDDFGTGFSSLSYLRQLPLQCLKIDQSFTQNMLQDPNAEKLTQAIVAMGNALKMTIVAEGVETDEQMRWLLAHGCHIGQGYYFSPGVVPAEVHRVIDGIEMSLAG